ncbi:MAG: dTDP-4-dehydrorhamnose 3,5-epimerase [Chloroflexi bacterium]|nr:dTDP-4-dehydrorhamnose 3,5-epimerase [Chloroflexota bacterium]
MRFQQTPVHGVVLITPDHFDDERGFLQRTWAFDEFEANGLETRMVQRNVSYNRARHTLRGMHFQNEPYAEVKLVSCSVGAIFDVALDIRPDSPTYGKWFGAELRPENGLMLYVPRGCAHGYLSLEPDSTVEYLISEFYHPEVAGGIRWDDSFFNIGWPAEPTVLNARDATWPDFELVAAGARGSS